MSGKYKVHQTTEIFRFQNKREEGKLPVDKSGQANLIRLRTTVAASSFSLNMIKGFTDPKMHAIGQSVHYGRLIELEKPEQAPDYI